MVLITQLNQESSASACVDLEECNTVSWTAGAWDSETSWSVGDLSGEAGSGAGTYGDCVVGCMDASANNCMKCR